MPDFKLRSTISIAIAAALWLSSGGANAEYLVAINSQNQISVFDSNNVQGAIFNTIAGDGFGESFVGIDLRPSNNLVYGLTFSNTIYTIDATTGVSSFVAALTDTVIRPGRSYGIDFNPVDDRGTGASLRLISSTGENFVVNAVTGDVTTAQSIGSGYTAIAYTSSDPSTPTTTPSSTGLYFINSNSDTLSFASTDFNLPAITTVGALNEDILRANGFEILANGTAFSAVTIDDGALKSVLTTIDMGTGAATVVGVFNGTINGLTVAAVPEPETYAMLVAGLGLIGAASRRKSKKV